MAPAKSSDARLRSRRVQRKAGDDDYKNPASESAALAAVSTKFMSPFFASDGIPSLRDLRTHAFTNELATTPAAAAVTLTAHLSFLIASRSTQTGASSMTSTSRQVVRRRT